MLQHVHTEVKGVIYVYVADCAVPLSSGMDVFMESTINPSSLFHPSILHHISDADGLYLIKVEQN